MDGWAALTALLLSPEGRAALTGGTPGQVVKLVRVTLRWTQQDLADQSGWSQSTISRIEDDKTRGARDIDVLADLARALGIPCSALYQAGGGDQGRTLDGMDRRDVLGRTLALAVAALLPQGVATAGRIDAAHVAQCWTALHRLFELDDQHGGTCVGVAKRSISLRRPGRPPGTRHPPPCCRCWPPGLPSGTPGPEIARRLARRSRKPAPGWTRDARVTSRSG